MSRQVMSRGKSRQSHQAGWMAHWMRPTSNATAERLDDNKDNELVSVDDQTTLEVSKESCRNEGMWTAVMEHGQEAGDTHATRPTIDQNLDSGKAINFEGGIRLSSGAVAVNGNSSMQVKPYLSAKDGTSFISMYSVDGCAGSSKHILPNHGLESCNFDKGKAVACLNNQLPFTKLEIIEEEDGQRESKMGNQSQLDTSLNDQEQSRYGKDWLQKMHKCPHVISLLPSRSSDNYARYPLQKLPSCAHETMRICTAVDAPPRGCPRTTRSMLITRNTRMNGNSSHGLECVPTFSGQANRGVTLQPISSSSSEGKGNAGDTGIGTFKYASRNESSAETDTMDMDIPMEERPSCGANSRRSTKVFNLDKSPSPRIDFASSREVKGHWMSSVLPRINLELPALPAIASSSEDIPTSSRTQSLEMDILLAQSKQPEPKSNLSIDDSPEACPTTRWVKRLKLSSSDSSSQGTKSLELPTHDSKRDLFRSILKKGITTKQHGGKLSKEDEQVAPNQPKKSKELLRSHVWIKRWLRNGSQMSQREPETAVVGEPRSSKASVDELQKKQFPSIAAMALMGRSMTGLQSCELRKRGTFTVWNTNTF